MRALLPLCFAIWSTLLASTVSAAVVSFPGRTSEAPSPNKMFAVLNADRDEEPNHFLSLRGKQGNVFPLFSYRRHVSVSWSPDSKFVFVNDYGASDYADCVVVNAEGQQKTNMSDALQDEIGDFMRNFKGSHLFLKCLSWRSKDKLVVSISGFGDGSPKTMERRYVFNPHNGKAVLAR